jgi:hypothetical protein
MQRGAAATMIKLPVETKQCKRCDYHERRLDAVYCCYCGVKYDVVIIERNVTYKTEFVPIATKIVSEGEEELVEV